MTSRSPQIEIWHSHKPIDIKKEPDKITINVHPQKIYPYREDKANEFIIAANTKRNIIQKIDYSLGTDVYESLKARH